MRQAAPQNAGLRSRSSRYCCSAQSRSDALHPARGGLQFGDADPHGRAGGAGLLGLAPEPGRRLEVGPHPLRLGRPGRQSDTPLRPSGLGHRARDGERRARGGARRSGLVQRLGEVAALLARDRRPAPRPRGARRAAAAHRRAALRPLRHAAARHRADLPQGLRRLRHRLVERPRRAADRGPFRLRRLHRPGHPDAAPHRRAGARDRGLPAGSAGAGRRRADGRGRRSAPAGQRQLPRARRSTRGSRPRRPTSSPRTSRSPGSSRR